MDLNNNRLILKKEIVSDLLSDILNDAIAVEAKYLKQAGITDILMSDINIINAIAKDDNPTMTSIAQRLSLTNGTISNSIKKLETKGYLQRRKDIYDKRFIRVSLTTKGNNIYALHQQFHEEIISRICDNDELIKDDTLISLLSKLSAYINEVKYGNELEK